MKTVKWLGSSKKDLLKLPNEVHQEIGYALYLAQLGKTAKFAKIFKGHGSGLYEIVSNYNKNTYRTIYWVKLNIYVLHVFQKKSKISIKTPKEEISVIRERLQHANSIDEEIR